MPIVLQGCGSGGSSDPDLLGRSGSHSSRVTIHITDAPVTNATEVWVQFSGLSLKPVDGDVIEFTFATPRNINLLALYGSRSEILLNNEVVPAGNYEWIRLAVNAAYDSVYDSYIRLDDGTVHELDVPTANTTGLRINNIPAFEASTPVNLTIDFDLAKSIVVSSGDYHLKPVLRLVNNDDVGSLVGTVDSELLITNCSDSDPATYNAVYIYSDGNVTPDDIDGRYPEPVTVASVNFNNQSGEYEYEVGFLPEGRYTIAFTCQVNNDDPEADDVIEFADVRRNVEVEADEEELNRFR